jgi:hypothetical protein
MQRIYCGEIAQVAIGAGILENRPENLAPGSSAGSPTITSIPKGAARVCMTAMFCGWQFSSMKNPAPWISPRAAP